MTYAGYIIGFPNDTPERIARDIEIIKDELADRPAGILLPDAAAGVGGSPAALTEGVGWTPT
jgi:hypothetical protein